MKLMGRKHATPPAVPGGRTDFQRPRDSRLAGSRGTPAVRSRGRPTAAWLLCAIFKARSEPAPVRRYSVIAMQLRFLRAIAPVEIPVGAERRRAPELVIVGIELVSLDPRVVGQARPRQREQVGSHAEEPAEAEDRVGHLAADLVDHQPLDPFARESPSDLSAPATG